MKIKRKSGKKPLKKISKALLIRTGWCVGLAVMLLLLPARFTAPARTVFMESAGPVLGAAYTAGGNTAAFTGTLRDSMIAQERERMGEQQLSELENQNLLLRESLNRIRSQVENLESFGIVSQGFTAVSAEVVAYDTVPWRRGFTIAAGTKNGLKGGEAVTAGGAMAGIVTETGPNFSRVRSVTDPAFRQPVRLTRTRTLYVMRGKDGIRSALELADRDREIQEDDIVVTALTPGHGDRGSAVPSGIPAGRVSAVMEGGERPLLRNVDIRPLIEVDRLEHVIVLRPEYGD